jgi:hypothetical protein
VVVPLSTVPRDAEKRRVKDIGVIRYHIPASLISGRPRVHIIRFGVFHSSSEYPKEYRDNVDKATFSQRHTAISET